jgi:hypothetical protein
MKDKEKAIEKDAEHAVKCGVPLIEYLRGCVTKQQSTSLISEYVIEVDNSGKFIKERNPEWDSHNIHSEIEETRAKAEKEIKDPEYRKLLDARRKLDEEASENIKQKLSTPDVGPIITPILCFLIAGIIVIAEAYQFALPYLNYIGVDIKALDIEMETNFINVASGFLFAGAVAVGLFFVAHTIMKILLGGDFDAKRIFALSCLIVLLVGVVYGVSALRHGLSQEAVESGGVSTIIFALISMIGLYAAAFCSYIGVALYKDRAIQKLRRREWKNKVAQNINVAKSIRAKKAIIDEELNERFSSKKKEMKLMDELRAMQMSSQAHINSVINTCSLHKKYFIGYAHLIGQIDLINLAAENKEEKPHLRLG